MKHPVHQQRPPRLISPETSDQIKYCRILCVLFMTIVHIPPGFSGGSVVPGYVMILHTLTADILGRASVSALSFISGYLFFCSSVNKNRMELIISRFKNLILPMIFWNLAIIATGLLLLTVTGEKIYVLRGLENLSLSNIIIDRILALNYGAASDSLNFLRDLFVATLLALLLAPLIKKHPWPLVAALFFIDQTVTFQPLVMRGMILVFFAVGAAFAVTNKQFSILTHWRLPALGFLLIVVSVELTLTESLGTFRDLNIYQWLKRVSVSVLFIDLALHLSRQIKNRFIDRIDQVTYLVFLSHNLVYLLLWGGWQLVFGPPLTPYYLVYYFGAPLLLIFLTTLFAKVLSRLPAPLQLVAFGRGIGPRSNGSARTVILSAQPVTGKS